MGTKLTLLFGDSYMEKVFSECGKFLQSTWNKRLLMDWAEESIFSNIICISARTVIWQGVAPSNVCHIHEIPLVLNEYENIGYCLMDNCSNHFNHRRFTVLNFRSNLPENSTLKYDNDFGFVAGISCRFRNGQKRNWLNARTSACSVNNLHSWDNYCY